MKPNQADREAAVKFLRERGFPSCHTEADLIELGEWDHHSSVQAFMRHRHAGMELARAEAAKVVQGEALINPTDSEDDKAYDNAIRDALEAILAIDLDALGEK
jgi:hypothetical protein